MIVFHCLSFANSTENARISARFIYFHAQSLYFDDFRFKKVKQCHIQSQAQGILRRKQSTHQGGKEPKAFAFGSLRYGPLYDGGRGRSGGLGGGSAVLKPS